MKRIILCCMMAMFAVAAFAEKQTVTLYIPGMECQNCQGKVDKVLAFERGVRSLDYKLEKRMVTIVFEDKKTDVAKLQAALVKHINYKSYEVDANGDMKIPAGETVEHQEAKPHKH